MVSNRFLERSIGILRGHLLEFSEGGFWSSPRASRVNWSFPNAYTTTYPKYYRRQRVLPYNKTPTLVYLPGTLLRHRKSKYVRIKIFVYHYLRRTRKQRPVIATTVSHPQSLIGGSTLLLSLQCERQPSPTSDRSKVSQHNT